MNRRFSTIYIILIYVSLALFVIQQGAQNHLLSILFLVCVIVTICMECVHIVRDIKFTRSGNLQREGGAERISALKELTKLKFGVVPFFVLHFLYWMILMLVPMGFVFLAFLPIDFILTYSIIITSGVTGIRTLRLYKQAGKLPERKASIYSILMFVPVLDVFGTIVLRRKLCNT